MSRFNAFTEGELKIGGQVVNERAPKDRDIAMVFQNYALYPHMSVRENMGFALKLAKAPKEEITDGDIMIGGQVVNDVPPKDRDIAMVFQNYALYPHMTVYENMSFGLRLKHYPKPEIARRVQEAARILDITDGEMLIDGRRVNEVPPAERGIAMVFQSYALYPHMSVRKNIAFPLRMAGMDEAELGGGAGDGPGNRLLCGLPQAQAVAHVSGDIHMRIERV